MKYIGSTILVILFFMVTTASAMPTVQRPRYKLGTCYSHSTRDAIFIVLYRTPTVNKGYIHGFENDPTIIVPWPADGDYRTACTHASTYCHDTLKWQWSTSGDDKCSSM